MPVTLQAVEALREDQKIKKLFSIRKSNYLNFKKGLEEYVREKMAEACDNCTTELID